MHRQPPQFASRVEELVARYASEAASLAELLCDGHPPEATAFRIVDQDLAIDTLTYGELRAESERFGSALRDLGVRRGDRVSTLMGKGRELVVTLIAIWRIGAIHIPLFTAFAPGAISLRLRGGAPKVVVADADNAPKLAALEADIPGFVTVVAGGPPMPDKTALSYATLLSNGSQRCVREQLGGSAPFIQIYTSGTTGAPKGVLIPARAVAGFHAYGEFAMDLRPDDVYWCAADPGWAYGLYFGVICSLATGVPSVLLKGGFSAERTFATLVLCGVTSFAAAPTTYRSLLASGFGAPSRLSLRCASSAGEPLTPEVNEWAEPTLKVTVADHYGQTEAGMLINNHHHQALKRPLKAGSMGIGMPGWSPLVLKLEADVPAQPGEQGRIAVDIANSPFHWFDGYLDAAEKSAEKFSADGKWYLTGDLGVCEEDGSFRFASREDDVILMAGYRIGPFEVESTLLLHPAVAEAAAIAVPDTIRGEVLEACVVLRQPHAPTPELARELSDWVKRNYAAHVYPRQIHFLDALPKTPSGKIQRNILRERHKQDPRPG